MTIGAGGVASQAPIHTSDSSTWGDWVKNGVTTAISGAVGWQASAVVGAWLPTMILNSAVNTQGWFWGGVIAGPALVKTTAPLVSLASGGAGVVASAGTGLLLVGAGMAVNKGIEVVGNAIETRNHKAGQRIAQFQKPEEGLEDILALDDFEDLFKSKTFEQRIQEAIEKDKIETNKAIDVFKNFIKDL